jgi:hypothetical protein
MVKNAGLNQMCQECEVSFAVLAHFAFKFGSQAKSCNLSYDSSEVSREVTKLGKEVIGNHELMRICVWLSIVSQAQKNSVNQEEKRYD